MQLFVWCLKATEWSQSMVCCTCAGLHSVSTLVSWTLSALHLYLHWECDGSAEDLPSRWCRQQKVAIVWLWLSLTMTVIQITIINQSLIPLFHFCMFALQTKDPQKPESMNKYVCFALKVIKKKPSFLLISFTSINRHYSTSWERLQAPQTFSCFSRHCR